ncbi:MAG: phosphatidylserine decarboxylase [Rickettsiaceae bacterium]|nr:phosphatidylserine decarboxylase [Rickettsiaceae bacterium]
MKNLNDWQNLIHKEGYVFIAISAILTFVLGSLSGKIAILGIIVTLFCAYFFRNPNRVTPIDKNLIIAPADGVIQSITTCPAPAELKMGEEEMTRVSIFLSVFDVHVNRIPIDGKIIALAYNPGKFLNASLDKASSDNERQSVVMETSSGEKIIFVQIAGLIARRIICDLEEGQEVKAGERYGIIRFGSRVDVYLPKKIKLNIAVGQLSVGGETILADLSEKSTKANEFAVR